VGKWSSEETVQRPAIWRRGYTIKVQMQSLMPDLSKITKAKRIEKMVAVHEWLSDIKALPGTNSHFLARVL
jgi:hypothetical protein